MLRFYISTYVLITYDIIYNYIYIYIYIYMYISSNKKQVITVFIKQKIILPDYLLEYDLLSE